MRFRDFTVQLCDGHRVGIAVVGRDDAFPIISCHGSGSSRLDVGLLVTQAEQAGVRLIALDRPGAVAPTHNLAIACSPGLMMSL
ncbi:hypothetical protein [Thermogemmatispora tikiterensis]|uniref:Alpha/beta hydrolase n=1 Tax=Thermogemmatispora tikiterensis TaxID=1825093 RepID=A0A328VBN2_9CHLR|nr:hypothetical protein [Thermogemmatispora tikiterensis]RAQ94161.1 hypothetical protein A4R35_01360 [Thermogemmatispora tikiterensis]